MTDAGGTVKCHGNKCDRPATVEFSCRNSIRMKWTSGGLFYCDEHGEKVSAAFVARGLETRLIPLGGLNLLRRPIEITLDGDEDYSEVKMVPTSRAATGHKRAALVGDHESRWTHPCCDNCWFVENHEDLEDGEVAIGPPIRIREAPWERCCLCGQMTGGGIYIRRDPAMADFCGQNPRGA